MGVLTSAQLGLPLTALNCRQDLFLIFRHSGVVDADVIPAFFTAPERLDHAVLFEVLVERLMTLDMCRYYLVGPWCPSVFAFGKVHMVVIPHFNLHMLMTKSAVCH